MRKYTTQMDAARKGIITPELEAVASKELMTIEELMPLVASGKVVICANKNHKSSFYYTMTGHFQRGADVIRANWKPGEFAPLTDRKLLDKTWANGTATSPVL